jgi:hypothetical protein
MGSILAIHAKDVKWSSAQHETVVDRACAWYYAGRMIACTDVHYTNTHAVAACILFHDWSDAHPDLAITERVDDPAPYEPGRFYRRELPALLSVISQLEEKQFNKPHATELYRQIVEQYPNSPYASQAKNRLAELEKR